MNVLGYFASDMLYILIVLAVAVVVRLVTMAVCASVRRRRERHRRQEADIALMIRLAWMMLDKTPSKVVYFTKDQYEASPEAAHLQMELTPNGFALKAAGAPTPDATRSMVLGEA